MNWKQAATHYFRTHETLNEQNRAWLRANVALDCPKLLQKMTREEVLAVGADPNSKTFSAARLMRTLVWQSLARVICGNAEPPGGNVRSFFYDFADPLFAQFNLYKHISTEDKEFRAFVDRFRSVNGFPYERYAVDELVRNPGITKRYTAKLSDDSLRDFVLQRIFQYQGPFLFPDTDAQYKMLGRFAGLIFVVEKEGLWKKYCQRYHSLYNITVMAGRGTPSWVSTEYLADQLQSRKIKNIRLACLVDWDPGGFNIYDDYVRKFTAWGFTIKTQTLLTSLDMFEKSVLETQANDLSHPASKSQETMNKEWFAKTNGIFGRLAGIHINLADQKRVDKAMKRWFDGNKPSAADKEAEGATHPQADEPGSPTPEPVTWEDSDFDLLV